MKLSICIPTYNREKELCQLLENAIEQIYNGEYCDSVEIVISDNASSDNTSEKVNSIISSYSDIKILYKRNQTNLGADRNYISSVDMASGKYCWIMGSDDLLAEGALARMMEEIDLGHTMYLCGRIECEKDTMTPMSVTRFLVDEIREDKVFSFETEKDWVYYMTLCRCFGGMFTYLTSVVFKKEAWDSVGKYECFYGTAYVNVFKCINILKLSENATLKYLYDPLVMNRTGNDSFLINAYQRIMLDLNGFIKLSEIFENDILKKEFKLLCKKEHPIIPAGVILKNKKEKLDNMLSVMSELGYDSIELNLFSRMCRHKLLTLLLYLDKLLKKIMHRK